MKAFVRHLFKFLTLFVGIVVTVILMVPAGTLVMLISMIWKTTDQLVSRLEGKK